MNKEFIGHTIAAMFQFTSPEALNINSTKQYTQCVAWRDAHPIGTVEYQGDGRIRSGRGDLLVLKGGNETPESCQAKLNSSLRGVKPINPNVISGEAYVIFGTGDENNRSEEELGGGVILNKNRFFVVPDGSVVCWGKIPGYKENFKLFLSNGENLNQLLKECRNQTTKQPSDFIIQAKSNLN
jgi:hypothetical protein